MGRIITDPRKLHRDQVQRPSSDKLSELAGQTDSELTAKAKDVRTASKLKSWPNFRSYVAHCMDATGRKLMAISRLQKNYLPEAQSIFRDLTEVVVDLFWVYGYFRECNSTGERIAERFYKFPAHVFLKTAEQFRQVAPTDHFLAEPYTTAKIKQLEDDAKQNLRSYVVIDKNADTELRWLQDTEWRALPGVVRTRSDAKWKARCERAASEVVQIANLKDAPYHWDLATLSAYAHWDPQQTVKIDEKEQVALADRDLNIALGFAHDALNLAYRLLGIDPPEQVTIMRQQFIYMST